MCTITKYDLKVCRVSELAFDNKYKNRAFLRDFCRFSRNLTFNVPCSKGLSVMSIKLSMSDCLDICTERICDMPWGVVPCTWSHVISYQKVISFKAIILQLSRCADNRYTLR